MPSASTANVLVVFLLTYCCCNHGAIQFLSSNGDLLEREVTVGNASDVVIEITCMDEMEGGNWTFPNGSSVPRPLTAFGVSQDPSMGILRIYPAPLIKEGLDEFVCSVDDTTASLNLTLFESLFFIDPLPSSLTPPMELNCTLADIPSANITYETTLTNSSCVVTSERGSFSWTVPIVDEVPVLEKQFIIQPINTTAATNDRANFVCIVNTDASLVNITWMFEPDFTAGSGSIDSTAIDDMDTVVMVTEGVVSEFGTSVLQINTVEMLDEGQYFCVAYFSDGVNITSDTASLVINNSFVYESLFRLRPPEMFTVTEGDSFALPCVAADNDTVSWSYEGTGDFNSTDFGTVSVTMTTIQINSVGRSAQGSLVCSVDGQNVTTNLSVLASLRFDSTPNNETVVYVGGSVTLECLASGNPSPYPIRWLRNNTEILPSIENISINGGSLTLNNAHPSDTAVYQCVAMTMRERISAYTYLVVEFIETPDVSPDTLLVNPLNASDFSLTCTIHSHPLVNIDWSVNGSNIDPAPRQVPVGFRGPSVSILEFNSGDLSGRVMYNCSAELNEVVVEETAVVNAFSPVNITMQPQDTDPVLVGYTVSFLCQARSIPIPTITWSRIVTGDEGTELSPDNNILIDVTEEGDSIVTSNLTITVDGDSFGEYSCRADNGMFNATSDTATLVRGAIPTIILFEPTGKIVVPGEVAIFTCRAQGNPLPDVTWDVSLPSYSTNNSILLDSNRTNQSTLNTSTMTNMTSVVCSASNIFNTTSSPIVFILLAGPPLAPTITLIEAGSLIANVTWVEPFSLVGIMYYTLELYEREENNERQKLASFVVTLQNTFSINETFLMPFTNYTVEVAARSRAGLSPPADRNFTTQQAAPDAPPTNVTSSAIFLNEILLTWAPPPSDFINGIIQRYRIYYQDATNDVINTTTTDALSFNLTGLTSGVQYRIDISAETVAPGPNATILQTTITAPPNIVGIMPTLPPAARSTTTTNSFPIQIPQQLAEGGAAVLWIVVIKTSLSFNTSISPDIVYPNNSTFIFASEYTTTTIPNDRPYIAAEISTNAITLPYTFLVGDESSTQSINDNSRYSNPPLQSSTAYTAFIRAFPPAASNGVVTKRQTQPTRQYTVFTSTMFLPIVQTSSPSEGLTGGEIAGIVISILLLFAMLGVAGVVLAIVWRSSRSYSKNLPPPSRKGSMRLSESQKLLETPQLAVRHNIATGTEIATINKNVRGSRNEPLSPLTPPDERVPILKSNFPDYVRTLHANSDHLFAEEYELIGIKSPSLSHQSSHLPCNVGKNRYANINSYDKTRVLLTETGGVNGSDYINANYIAGYKDTAYIAAQGPLPETTQEFWRMVWEKQSSCIVMLTNTVEKGRMKCHQYWPTTGSISFNDMTISVIDEQVLAYYTIRTFVVNMGNDQREVKQFHYTSWPDFGVPDHPNPILSFIRRVNNSSRKTDGPDIIHCSAGVGRTGTYITIQSMIKMMDEEQRLDIFNFVLGMRYERQYMVQTEAQYIFIHDAIVELIRVGNTELSIQKLQKELKQLSNAHSDDEICALEEQFDKLNSLDMPNHSNYISSVLPVNKEKNRFPDILPYEPYRVRLLMLPGLIGSDYINASYVDGYLRRNQFILTQGPLQNTVNDFWRMIWEHRVSAVVMLCSLEEKGKEQSARYWPNDKMTQYGDMFVETLSEKDSGFYCMRELQITHTKQNNDIRSLKHFHYTEWPEEKCPDSSTALLDMISLVQKAHHYYGGGPVIVHDSTSIGRAGTFCVLNIVIERLKVEGMVDMFFTVHSLRRKHPGIVCSYDQYLFCYNTVQEYLDSFDNYSNFN